MHQFFTKNGLGKVLGNFFTDSSGHPGSEPKFELHICYAFDFFLLKDKLYSFVAFRETADRRKGEERSEEVA
jgi:hypothetical protein